MAGPTFFTALHGEAGVKAVTANTNLDGQTGTYYVVATGDAGGTKVKKVHISAEGTTTEGWVRFWIDKGAFSVLVGSVYVPPQVSGEKVPVFNRTWAKEIILPDNTYTLIAATHTGDDFNLLPEAVDLV